MMMGSTRIGILLLLVLTPNISYGFTTHSPSRRLTFQRNLVQNQKQQNERTQNSFLHSQVNGDSNIIDDQDVNEEEEEKIAAASLAATAASAAAVVASAAEEAGVLSTDSIVHPPQKISPSTDDEPTVSVPPPPITPPGHSISSNGSVHTVTIHLGIPNHEPVIIETGKIGRQASGAVTLTRGSSVLYATAAVESDVRDIDFLPLSVEHQERFSSAGLTSGSYNKRDGRPAEHEILTCRLIDRPIRPLIKEGWRHETQLLSWVLSYDGERSCDPLAITAAGAALWVSEVPLLKPVSAVVVGRVDGELVMNPTNEMMEKSDLNLVLAGTKEAVLMIEGAAEFLSEEVMMKAVAFGHEGIKTICTALEEFGKVAGREKRLDTIETFTEGLQERVDELMTDKVREHYNSFHPNKDDHSNGTRELTKYLIDTLEPEFPEQSKQLKIAFKDLLKREMFYLAKTQDKRVDGRSTTTIRPISIETAILPRVHGSTLFTRGETQAIATATLGDAGMKQKIDKIDGLTQKRFYLQYTFPPSCVGETGRVGAPGRREVGHGNLAERALIPAIPPETDFPYSIRVESLITESHGSSSMASVCGGTLALMDAGVPIKSPVAGIAMGMLLGDDAVTSDENAVILSDILGTEDALGMMDFKVAGDRTGITTFQLDIKCEGLTLDTMQRALEQARQGRLHILDEMENAMAEPKTELPPTVPRMATFKIEEAAIGKVIGPGGKQIRAIIEDFDLVNMNVDEDGTIQISSMNTTNLELSQQFVENLVSNAPTPGKRGNKEPRPQYEGPPAEIGKTYKGKITGVHQFGVFVEILPGAPDGATPGLEGLCHVSELHVERVRNCEAFVGSMNVDELEVKLLGINAKGQLQLSRKAVLEEKKGGGGGGGRNGAMTTAKSQNKAGKGAKEEMGATEMEQGEVDAIAKAIESILED